MKNRPTRPMSGQRHELQDRGDDLDHAALTRAPRMLVERQQPDGAERRRIAASRLRVAEARARRRPGSRRRRRRWPHSRPRSRSSSPRRSGSRQNRRRRAARRRRDRRWRGKARPRLANTSASSNAPRPVTAHDTIEIGPAAPASDAGSRNTPDPIMLPTTNAVAIHSPIVRLSFRGRARGAPDGESMSNGTAVLSSRKTVGWIVVCDVDVPSGAIRQRVRETTERQSPRPGGGLVHAGQGSREREISP